MQLKWIVLASICSFALVSIGRSMVRPPPDERMVYITASYPTKDACLTGAAERVAACADGGCYRNAWGFLDQCLVVAEDETGDFCHNVSNGNADAAGRDVFGAHCEPFEVSAGKCQKIVEHVGAFCAEPAD